MCYKILQKQPSPRTSLKASQKFFFIKEVIRCYNVLQPVTMRYKKLQKIGMSTSITTNYNALQDLTKTMQPKDYFDISSKFFFLKEEVSY